MDRVETMQPSADDLDRCAQEQVHTIGFIQPHGVLFALSEPDLLVRQVSANVSAVCGLSPPTVLGRSFEVVLGAHQFEVFRGQVLSGEPPFANVFRATVDGCEVETQCLAHRRDGLLLVELEFLQGVHSEPLNLNTQIRLPISRMESASSILDLSQTAAAETRRLSGFDRVMIYRFDEEWGGEVIAEATSPSSASYLGFRFPAGDIPAQVRGLFLLNRLRAIVDVDAAPVAIVPEIGPLTGRALDLTCSFLRSPAPIHLEYLRNMGVQSSLVLSIVVGGRLWGMIACHHATPRHVDWSTRSVCELIGQMLGSQLAMRIENAALQLRLTSRKLLESYMAHLDASPTDVYADHFRSQRLLELFAADGLLLHIDGVLWSVGLTVENKALLLPIVSRLQALSTHGIGSSNMLGSLDPGAGAYALQASGALYVGLSEASGDYLLLVRRELLETLVWAGNPDKGVRTDERGGLHPRTSFAAWQETVRGHARPWSDPELESARSLREQLLRLKETLNVANIEKVRLFESLQSTQRFRFVADTMPQLVWTTTPDGRADYFNQRWYTYTGISLERSIDRGWEDAIHPDDISNCMDRWTRSVAKGFDFEAECRIRRGSDRTYEWHLARGFPLRNHLGEVVQWVGTFTNIEGQKQARYELEEAVVERTADLRRYTMALERSNKELDGFAYAASHDLKAPLRVIHNASMWIEEDMEGNLPPEVRENMTLLRSRVWRMNKLLDDLLEYSRIGRETDDSPSEPISGAELMENIVGLVSPPEGFILHATPAFAGIEVFRMPLQQILINLISNAIKHHNQKVGRIEVSVEDLGTMFRFHVKDDGPGIPAQYHEQIFRMFQTLKPRDQVEGSGMGLAIVRKHVEVAGGELKLESAVGQGSTFSFTWPKQDIRLQDTKYGFVKGEKNR